MHSKVASRRSPKKIGYALLPCNGAQVPQKLMSTRHFFWHGSAPCTVPSQARDDEEHNPLLFLRCLVHQLCSVQALQFRQASFGSPAFSCSIARCSALAAAGAEPFAGPAWRTLSTSTVNLIASAAAFVRR